MGPRGGVVTQRSANRRRVHSGPTSEILEALKVSGTSVIFDLGGVALIRYRSHFIAVTVAALPGVA